MDGYLDQQVPYTLANVRMEKLSLLLQCFSVCFFGVVFECARPAGALSLRFPSRVCTEAAAVCARQKTSSRPA